jgi:hypothetical protein
MKKIKAKTLRSKQPLSPIRLIIIIGLTLVLGVLIVWRIFAATAPIAFEAEIGKLTAGATNVANTVASGGLVTQFGTPTPTVNTGSVFTLASLPDTQRDLWNASDIANKFDGRLNYLAQNKSALNLKFVWQVGDLEDTDNLIFSSDKSINPRYMPYWTIDHYQYVNASAGLKILENAGVPYSLTVGNHDTGAVCGGPACPVVAGQTSTTPVEVRNTKVFNAFYPPSRFPGIVTFEDGKSDNAYRTFQAGGLTFLVMNLELWPRTVVIDWARTVVAAHPHDNVIITIHSYLTGGGTIDQTNGGYGANTGQFLYDNLIKLYPNIKFVFSGHVGLSDYHLDTGINGNKIYDFMDTYHDTTNNWIRLLTFDTTLNTIKTRVYAPYTGQTRTESAANISLTDVSWIR